jgi:hypothetical protein
MGTMAALSLKGRPLIGGKMGRAFFTESSFRPAALADQKPVRGPGAACGRPGGRLPL